MDEKNIVNTSNMNDFLSDLKPVAYASKSLSDADTCYANIERELLGVVFGVKHFTLHMFIILISLLITNLCYHYLRNLSLIQPLIYQDCCYAFQSMI